MSASCHWAAPGVRCVCVEDHWGEVRVGSDVAPTRVPMLGEVLTVHLVQPGSLARIGGKLFGDLNEIFLSFVEIPSTQTAGALTVYGLGWVASAFRPLVERKTDISVFTEMLDRAPARASETERVSDRV
jgi:hypothetical protein